MNARVAIAVLGALLLCGCPPKPVVPMPMTAQTGAHFDSSVPSPYDQAKGGFCTWTTRDHPEGLAAGDRGEHSDPTTGAFISPHAAERWRSLSAKYGARVGRETGREIAAGEGLQRKTDRYGNLLEWLPAEDYEWFLTFVRWSKQGESP